LQLRFIQHLQSDYVFRLLLAREVHVAEFPATERFAYIEVFQLFVFYYYVRIIRGKNSQQEERESQ